MISCHIHVDIHFRFLSLRVSDCTTASEIWVRLQSYHEETAHVKSRLYETYKREYENFSQLDGESIDSLFSRFQTIVNKMRANRLQLPYDDHERALKVLYALDRKVWDVKVSAIIESANYDTLIVDELSLQEMCGFLTYFI
jgi:hypothetical protein